MSGYWGGQAGFRSTGLHSDVVIEVGDITFRLHKFPLVSKSRKLHRLITDLEHDDARDKGKGDINVHHHSIILPDFPGGPDTFEAAANFCYGVRLELTPWNAAPLRCAAEYLEMTDDFFENNLASRTDLFLLDSVLSSLRDSIHALKSCEHLLPLADDLGIVESCVDSIAARACSADSGSLLFSCPARYNPPPLLWNGIDTGAPRCSRSTSSSSTAAGGGSWLDDLAVLTLPFYKRVVAAMRAADPSSEALERSLVSYARRSIPGLSRSGWKHPSAPVFSEAEQRDLLETVVASLPPEKTVAGLTTASFLFTLLRNVGILRASEASRAALESRIASQLEQATVDDLLIRSYSYQADEALYDVGCVERILRYFLEDLQQGPAPNIITAAEEEEQQGGARSPAERLARVGRLVDEYLDKIASDGNLKPGKFCDIALALPNDARVDDDGLYRAVDSYLKAHMETTEEERDLVCGVMNCHKLTLRACSDAAQNKRMPLRVVVTVILLEQIHLFRRAIGGTVMAAGVWRSAAARENEMLRLEMDTMRIRLQELEMDCSSKIERIDRGASATGGWSSFAEKMGCKSKTEACDSHEPRRKF